MRVRSKLPACLAGGVLLICAACGDKPPADPGKPADRQTQFQVAAPRPAPPPTGESAMNLIRNAATPNERAIMIRRSSRVAEEDQPAMIVYLKDILDNAPGIHDRIAAAAALIDINTAESLLPIKLALLFRMDNRLNAAIVDKLNRNLGAGYKAVIANWCAESLNTPENIVTYSDNQLLAALNLFAVNQSPDGPFIDPRPFLTGHSEQLAAKMYQVMRAYPRAALPLAAIRDALAARIEAGQASAKDFEGYNRMCSAQSLTADEAALKIPGGVIPRYLDHTGCDMRLAVINLLPAVWGGLDEADRAAVAEKISTLAEQDETFIDNEYPVRKRAAAMMAELIGAPQAPPVEAPVIEEPETEAPAINP